MKQGERWEKLGDKRKEMECRLCGWWQRYQKKKIFSLNRASLNNPPII